MKKKSIFALSPKVTYPDGITECKKTQAQNSHVWAPIKGPELRFGPRLLLLKFETVRPFYCKRGTNLPDYTSIYP
jgi:hypothetical protein